MNLANVMALFRRLDYDTLKLFADFVSAASKAENPSAYVKAAMRAALEGDVQVIEGRFAPPNSQAGKR